MNAAFWNVRGLNRRDHQVAVKELVNEFRLNFLGLFETRVSAVNVLRVQSFLPRWSWFTDYDMPGHASTTSQDPMVKRGDQCSRIFFRKEESQALVQSVTREEIKDAFFDIAEDKAPGPDGYSSGFYKAAWPVYCEEMIKAILEFFTTGRLLKQRLRLVLDKLISPSQNAFVPGRSIGDNILLAQELFAGYNRQGLPMRCALKVDLRKAYDTVEWDFLSACYKCLDFRAFIGWVEECVTTPMFSVCINGNPHGFLQGFQGVKTRGSDVPVLVRSDNGGPAVDMTSSSSVKDVASVRVFRHGLAEFAKLSGLHANPQKSQLISPVQHRMSGNNYLQHYISRRVTFPSGWESIQLSFAGRLQLIKSVLMSLNVYWANGLHITERGHQRGGKKMRTFLWKGNSAVGYPKVAWSVVCKPIEEGGQGIRDILALNKALMSRHLWNVIQNNQSSIWVKWIAHTRLRQILYGRWT
ncbi:UNVERIFIED_CONTAM: putative ribonuclease H protein [Sesamum radiatum]|uniref:Ribonuclease H protein n=1 Tax=Sesamum radiatum TaxID=300843 RepID=A0AAW2J0I9_SESRA